MDSRQRRRVGDDADDGGPGLFGLAAGPIKTLLRLVVGGLARVLCDPCPVRQFSKIERVLLMTKAARLELQVQGEQAAAAWDEPAASRVPMHPNWREFRSRRSGRCHGNKRSEGPWPAEGRVGKLIDNDQGMADSPARWRFCRAHASIHPASGRYTAAGHRYPPGVFCYTRHPMYTVGNRVNYECCTRMHAVPRPLTGLQ